MYVRDISFGVVQVSSNSDKKATYHFRVGRFHLLCIRPGCTNSNLRNRISMMDVSRTRPFSIMSNNITDDRGPSHEMEGTTWQLCTWQPCTINGAIVKVNGQVKAKEGSSFTERLVCKKVQWWTKSTVLFYTPVQYKKCFFRSGLFSLRSK